MHVLTQTRSIKWIAPVAQLDFAYYLPIFLEGLREMKEPYKLVAQQGIMSMIRQGGTQRGDSTGQILAALHEDHIINIVQPIKDNLYTRDPSIMKATLLVLTELVRSCPMVATSLVPYFRQILNVCNLFITKRVNCGDRHESGSVWTFAGRQRSDNIGDLILLLLDILAHYGGDDAYVNIKYLVPTYERTAD
jgi:hypothetical protein